MSFSIVGTKYDGTLSICKAKPEHRGKGSCKHFEHEEIDSTKVDAYIQEKNEKTLSKRHAIFGTVKKPKPSRKERRRIIDLDNFWKLEELYEASKTIQNNYKFLPHQVVESFNNSYNLITDPNEDEESVQSIANFLNSETETAIAIRNYLGSEADVEALAQLLVKKPNGMNKQNWSSSGKVSVSRAILSSLHYDMDHEKYIESVLFFKGRCCYCNKTLNAKNRSSMPTAEHLTPVSAEKPDSIRGSTKYGNMSLCCNLCNTKRQDQELSEWLAKTTTVKKNVKPYSLGRINAFRKYTKYKEYTREENTLINEAINEAANFAEKYRNSKDVKGFIKGSSELVKPEIEKIIEKLEKELARTDTQ